MCLAILRVGWVLVVVRFWTLWFAVVWVGCCSGLVTLRLVFGWCVVGFGLVCWLGVLWVGLGGWFGGCLDLVWVVVGFASLDVFWWFGVLSLCGFV